MSEAAPLSPWAPESTLGGLAVALAAADGALVALLIQMLESADASVAVKDMTTGLYVHAGAPPGAPVRPHTPRPWPAPTMPR